MTCFLFPTAEDKVHKKWKKKIFFYDDFLWSPNLVCLVFSHVKHHKYTEHRLLFFIDNIRVERFQFSKAKPKIIIFKST